MKRKPKRRQRYVRTGIRNQSRYEFPQRFAPCILVRHTMVDHIAALGQARDELERKA